jgi:hypothetical protein
MASFRKIRFSRTHGDGFVFEKRADDPELASFSQNHQTRRCWVRFCETQKPGIAVASFCRACRQSLRWLRFEKLPDEDDFALKIRVASFSQNHRDR